jgi:hypothetical protein
MRSLARAGSSPPAALVDQLCDHLGAQGLDHDLTSLAELAAAVGNVSLLSGGLNKRCLSTFSISRLWRLDGTASRTPFSLGLSSLGCVPIPVSTGSTGLSLRPPGSMVSPLSFLVPQAACLNHLFGAGWYPTPLRCPLPRRGWSVGGPAGRSLRGASWDALGPTFSRPFATGELLLAAFLSLRVCSLGRCVSAGSARFRTVARGLAVCSAARPVSMLGSGSYSRGLGRAQTVLEIALALQASESYAGETNHSFRRGSLEAAAQRGLGEDELKTLGQIRSTAVLERYSDVGRHLGAPPAQRRRVL